MRTILIVDDDESFRQMLCTVLQSRGFNVLLAASAGEGLELAACHEIAAAVTDYQMPSRNGIEFCRALRQQNQVVDRRVPIFLMTGSLKLKTGDALAAGATRVFRKPFHAIEVCKEIERHIAGASQHVPAEMP